MSFVLPPAPEIYSRIQNVYQELTNDSIDGVLYQGRNRVDGAEKVIKMLRSNGIRYVFLTNGGCVPEDKKAETLQERLQVAKNDDVVKGRMILSHTPMSGWSDHVKNNGTVLITGSHPENARQIALG